MAINYLGTNVQVPTNPQHQIDVAGAFSNYIRGKTGSGLTDAQIAQNEFQQEMANTQYQRGVKDMQEAGLNPALMYGNGASPAPSPTGADVGQPNFNFQEAVSMLSLPLQLESIKADIIKKREDTESVRVQREKTLQEISNLKQTWHEIQSRTDLNDTQQANLVTIGMYLDRMQEATLHKIESEYKLNNQVRRRIDALLPGELAIQDMTIEDFAEKWRKIDAEIGKIAAETKLLKEDLVNYAVNHMSTGAVADIMRAYLENNRDFNRDGKADDRGE